jgi:hypothetical protein
VEYSLHYTIMGFERSQLNVEPSAYPGFKDGLASWVAHKISNNTVRSDENATSMWETAPWRVLYTISANIDKNLEPDPIY